VKRHRKDTHAARRGVVQIERTNNPGVGFGGGSCKLAAGCNG
jgi:hypothetical protein